MLFVLLGEDDFSLEQALEEIKRGLGDPVLLAASAATLDGRQVTLEQLRAICGTIPFLAEKRLVIVRGLLERFEAEGKSSRRKKTELIASQREECRSIASCVCQVPDSTVVVMIDSRINSANPLLKQLSGKATVRQCPLLREAKLGQWIERRVSAAGGSISRQAVGLLARLVGGNLWVMANEVDKLLLFASGRRVEEEDIRTVVSYEQEVSVFALVDAIFELKARLAQELLQQLLQTGAAPAYVMVMLARQMRMLVRAKRLAVRGNSAAEIQNRLGLASEFALQRTLEQAARYSMEQLKEVYRKLLETDLLVKTGRFDGELALTLLVADLCEQRRTRRLG